MIKLPAAMTGRSFDHGWEMIPFMTPHRANHGEIVAHGRKVYARTGSILSHGWIYMCRPWEGRLRWITPLRRSMASVVDRRVSRRRYALNQVVIAYSSDLVSKVINSRYPSLSSHVPVQPFGATK